MKILGLISFIAIGTILMISCCKPAGSVGSANASGQRHANKIYHEHGDK